MQSENLTDEQLWRAIAQNTNAMTALIHQQLELAPALAWSEQRGMPVMAYSPLGGPGASVLRDPTLARIGAAHGCSAAAIALAWTIRSGNVIAIPESGSVAHVKENAVALSLSLTSEELLILDAAHPPPRH